MLMATAAAPKQACQAALFALPSCFQQGDLVVVRPSDESTDAFWLAVAAQDLISQRRQPPRQFLKVVWLEVHGCGISGGALPQDAASVYQRGAKKKIEVLSTLCVLRRAVEQELTLKHDDAEHAPARITLTAHEWQNGLAAVYAGKCADEGADDEHSATPFLAPSAEKQVMASRSTPEVAASPPSVGGVCVQPACGRKGEWVDISSAGTEVDVRDKFGRWYGGRVLNGHVSKDQVRFELCAWDGQNKCQIVLPKTSLDIAPAGSQLLVPSIGAGRCGGPLILPNEVEALTSGTRVSFMWCENEWYDAVMTSSLGEKWGCWWKLNFDSFAGAQLFDMKAHSQGQRLRRATEATPPSAIATVMPKTPERVKPTELQKMCATDLTNRRIARYWETEDSEFRGTVLSCNSFGFTCQYDDGEVLFSEASDEGVRLLSLPPPVVTAVTAAEQREFQPGFKMEYLCASRHGPQWLQANVIAAIPQWPGWYCVALDAGAATLVETEVLLRWANKGTAWRELCADRSSRDSRDASPRLPTGFEHHDVAKALSSPAVPWGRLAQEHESVPVETKFSVDDAVTLCCGDGDSESIVRICDTRGNKVEVQWYRRGPDTCVGEAWEGSEHELFLCKERHWLPTSMLRGSCKVPVGPARSTTSLFCLMTYDPTTCAFADRIVTEPLAEQNERPLSSMDLYCGAGFLTEGLKRAGIKADHGVESDKDASAAWDKNNPDGHAWTSECRALLDRIIKNERGLPQPNTMHLLVMGPPCQGWTTLKQPAASDEENRNELFVGLDSR